MKTTDPHYITVGSERLPLIVKKHPRARNLVVRYDARGACVRVTVPRYVSVKSAVEFAQSKAGWVEKQREKTTRIAFEDGAVIPLWGEEVRLLYVGGRGVVTLVENDATAQGAARSGGPVLKSIGGEGPQRTQCKQYILRITGAQESMSRRVRDYIIKEMKIRSGEIAMRYASQLGVKIASIRIGDMRSRWGSCTRKGALSLSLRLAFTPAAVFDYVVCHEVAHILHHNHSARFWQTVEALCPDYMQHEAWLTKHGQSVWSYG